MESTENWAANEPGFMGSARRLTCCARCGEFLSGGYNKPRKVFDLCQPTMHFLCDDCFDQLPE
jgi:hypothetical protein